MTDFKTTFEESRATYESISNPLLQLVQQPVNRELTNQFGETVLITVNPTINVIAEELHGIGLNLQEQIRNSENPDSLNKEVASIFTDITSRRIQPDAEESETDAFILYTAIGYGILAGLTDTEVFDEEESNQE